MPDLGAPMGGTLPGEFGASNVPPAGPKDSRLDILGLPVSAVNLPRVIDLFTAWIAERSRHYICVRDVHGVVLSQDDDRLMRIHRNASLNTPDGMPLVWLLRAHGHRDADRVYGPDLLEAVCAAPSLAGSRHFFYGGQNDSATAMIASLKARHPALIVVGHHEPPFRPSGALEDSSVIEAINASQADIVWIGLGTPKQEYWMANHRASIEAPILIGVGAAFDFYAGTATQAPRWIQRSGFEWLFRVFVDPKRLGARYARVVPRFVALLARSYGRRLLRRHATWPVPHRPDQ